ncbi:Flp family type IVb pilin [Jeongeupia wiesaeckerbachi]|uniref:Flp family type IVb pilin n=1 Tax=Jeongeupia wiesaeckerbachi TaxID=3051218 RepID=UPI003D800D32
MQFLRRLARDERGVTSIEYGILAAGLAVAIGALVSSDGAFTKSINQIFQNIVNTMPQSGGAKQ